MHTKKSIENFDTMCDLLEDRLNILGEIRTDDAWKICFKNFGYSATAYYFKRIMNIMVEVGKARNIRNGLWVITKPNTKAPVKEIFYPDGAPVVAGILYEDDSPVKLEKIERFTNKK